MTAKYKIAFFFITIYLLSCNENLNLQEKDVKKYDYLKPFVANNVFNLKGKHNIDSEDFEFSYKVSNVQTTLSKIKEKSNIEGWQSHFVDIKTTSYSKKVKLFEAESTLVVVNVMLKDKDDRIYFKVN